MARERAKDGWTSRLNRWAACSPMLSDGFGVGRPGLTPRTFGYSYLCWREDVWFPGFAIAAGGMPQAGMNLLAAVKSAVPRRRGRRLKLAIIIQVSSFT